MMNVVIGVKFHSLCQNTKSVLFKVQQVDKNTIKSFLKRIEAEDNVKLKLYLPENMFVTNICPYSEK